MNSVPFRSHCLIRHVVEEKGKQMQKTKEDSKSRKRLWRCPGDCVSSQPLRSTVEDNVVTSLSTFGKDMGGGDGR
ncbi:hypothetical protein NL676_009548 [Syzygium grande]|nr:hypothetical protein NL676_009548 [Syzygium grande]